MGHAFAQTGDTERIDAMGGFGGAFHPSPATTYPHKQWHATYIVTLPAQAAENRLATNMYVLEERHAAKQAAQRAAKQAQRGAEALAQQKRDSDRCHTRACFRAPRQMFQGF
eukprot:4352304-Pyramimonas_sp.AAC.1